MAMRYSGNVRIRVVWDDAASTYRTHVSAAGYSAVMTIGHPPAARLAVDSPSAYDQAAHAAVSFALEEPDIGDHMKPESAPDGSGWTVHRRRHRT